MFLHADSEDCPDWAGCPGGFETSLWAQVILSFLSCSSSNATVVNFMLNSILELTFLTPFASSS